MKAIDLAGMSTNKGMYKGFIRIGTKLAEATFRSTAASTSRKNCCESIKAYTSDHNVCALCAAGLY